MQPSSLFSQECTSAHIFYVISKKTPINPTRSLFPFPLSAALSFPFFSTNSNFIFKRRIPREGFDLDSRFIIFSTKHFHSRFIRKKNFHPKASEQSNLLFIGFARYQLLQKNIPCMPYYCANLYCV